MEQRKNYNWLWLLLISVLPFIYLGMVWVDLPEKVAIHFNFKGEPDSYGSKSSLIWLLAIMIAPIYLLFHFMPSIDPKQKIESMGNSFEKLKFLTLGLMAALSIYIIYHAKSGGELESKFLAAVMGIFFMVLGNYMPTIKPNYFMGVRTPWTLESEPVWRKTHRLAGPIFMIGGLIVTLLALTLGNKVAIPILLTFVLVTTTVLVVYSYLEFKKDGS